MCVSCACCVLSGIGLLRRADHSSRGVVPTVVCLSVISNHQQVEGLGLGLGPLSIREGKCIVCVGICDGKTRFCYRRFRFKP